MTQVYTVWLLKINKDLYSGGVALPFLVLRTAATPSATASPVAAALRDLRDLRYWFRLFSLDWTELGPSESRQNF